VRDGRGDQRLAGAGVGDVGRHHERFGTERDACRGQRFEARAVTRREHQLRPLRREPQGEGTADALRRAGQDDDLARECAHVHLIG